MEIDEFAEWKIEGLAKAIDWLTARATPGDEKRSVLISQEDWDLFQKNIQAIYDAKESDVPYFFTRELP